MTIIIVWGLLGIIGICLWSLVLGAYSNKDDWPEPKCELCGDKECWYYLECDKVLCIKCAEYEEHRDDLWGY